MAEYVYCMSNPSVPGVICIDRADTDPAKKQAALGRRSETRRIDWTVRVADSRATEKALKKALADHADEKWPSHYHCDAMRARGIAIQFTTARSSRENEQNETASALPALVLGLGLAVQFLGFAHGYTGPSPALIAAALFWVVYMLPIGSRHRSAV